MVDAVASISAQSAPQTREHRGHPLVAVSGVCLGPGDCASISTGESVDVPEQWVALTIPNIDAISRGILCQTQAIYTGETSEIKLVVSNASNRQASIQPGEVIARLVFLSAQGCPPVACSAVVANPKDLGGRFEKEVATHAQVSPSNINRSAVKSGGHRK